MYYSEEMGDWMHKNYFLCRIVLSEQMDMGPLMLVYIRKYFKFEKIFISTKST